jgi:hypothetical protein
MNLLKYKNATKVKLKNRRVMVYPIKEDLLIEIKTISSDLRPRAVHTVLKDKLVITGFKLSEDAAIALFACLGEELKKKGLIQ